MLAKNVSRPYLSSCVETMFKTFTESSRGSSVDVGWMMIRPLSCSGLFDWVCSNKVMQLFKSNPQFWHCRSLFVVCISDKMSPLMSFQIFLPCSFKSTQETCMSSRRIPHAWSSFFYALLLNETFHMYSR